MTACCPGRRLVRPNTRFRTVFTRRRTLVGRNGSHSRTTPHRGGIPRQQVVRTLRVFDRKVVHVLGIDRASLVRLASVRAGGSSWGIEPVRSEVDALLGAFYSGLECPGIATMIVRITERPHEPEHTRHPASESPRDPPVWLGLGRDLEGTRGIARRRNAVGSLREKK
jgi:hypothetical protein